MKKKKDKISNETERECRHCGEIKPLSSEFHKNKQQHLGYHIYCKICRKKYNHNSYVKRREEKKERLLNA